MRIAVDESPLGAKRDSQIEREGIVLLLKKHEDESIMS